MLAVVCKTRGGLKVVETYDKEGLISKVLVFMELVGSSIGRPLDERYLVICLEKLRFEVMMISSCKCISYSLPLLYSLIFFIFGLSF